MQILLKEIKEDANKWKDILIQRLENLILKCSYYPQQSTDFNAIAIKTPLAFITEMQKKILKFICKLKPT